MAGYGDMKVSELKDLLSERGLKKSGSKKDLIDRLKDYDSVPAKVADKALYIKAREKVKSRVKVWPSAYASGQVQTEYKRMGGTYRGEKKGKLDRWYQEKWVNVCKPKGRGYEPCGREQSKPSQYPYCRPLKRITKGTPMTVGELKKKYGKAKLEEMCGRKQKKGLPKAKTSAKSKGLCPSSITRGGVTLTLKSESSKSCEYKRVPKSPKRVYHSKK